MNPKVSIIIRCYNEEQHIGKLLVGVSQQTCQDFEIIIVDSGSTDATLAIASRYPTQIISIKPEEFSFGKSLNIGCEAARGDYLVIVSAHVYPVRKDWLETLLKPFNTPQVALVYGKQRGNDLTKYSERQIFSRWFPEASNYNQTHPFCNNANAVIRKSLWEKFPYDDQLTGLEDLAWAKSVSNEGYCTAYSSEAEIVHVHDESPGRTYNRYRREAIAFKNIFPQENFRLTDFLRLFFANVVSDYYHAFWDQALIQNLVEIPVFRLMQFWGTYRGFHQHGKTLKQLRHTFYYPRQLNRHENVEDMGEVIDYSESCQQEITASKLQ